MKSCLIYCRVSTEEQADKGYSLDTQERLCREFAKRDDYKVVEVYRDEGKSATSLDRPALQEMLSRCTKDSGLAAVIVQETDRLARNTKDHLTIKAILKKAGTKLISIAQPMLDDSPEGLMIDTILASVNQFQSDINGRKTSRGLKERFEQGLWPGWVPIGYLNVQVPDSTSGKARRVVRKDPDRWDLMREGFQLYLTGEYSVREVCDLLYKKGLRTRAGKKVARNTMRSALRNPFYAGIMIWNGAERPGNHEAMVSLREHRRIGEIIDAHNSHACRRRKHQFLLRGFVYCNICGRRYTADIRPGRKYAYYHCVPEGKHSNRNQNVAAPRLEQAVEEQFRKIEFGEKLSERIIKRLRADYLRHKGTVEASRQALLNQKKTVEAKRDRAEEKLLDGVLSNEDFLRLKTKFTQELAVVDNQLEKLGNAKELDTGIIAEVLNLSQSICRTYKDADYTLKRHYLALFWDKFLVQDRQIVNAIPTRLVQEFQNAQGFRIRTDSDPWQPLIRTLEDTEYLSEIREQLQRIAKVSLPGSATQKTSYRPAENMISTAAASDRPDADSAHPRPRIASLPKPALKTEQPNARQIHP